MCVQVGRRTPARKLSPIRVVAEFNRTIHIDFMFITIRDTSVIILHIVDSATAFSVAVFVPSRDLSHAASQFEEQWICFHVAPFSLAADPEFARLSFKIILDKHHIIFAERPARRHQKTACVERKNGVLRRIIHCLAFADKTSPLAILIARAPFCANALLGNMLCASFKLARGYTPDFGSLPRSIVDAERVHAYHELKATRAIHRM
jgi:hypothetical protein